MSRTHYTRDEFLPLAHQQREQLRLEMQRAEHYANVHHERRAELGRSYAQASHDLGVAVLPELTLAALTRAVEVTGYGQLLADNPLGQLAAERLGHQQRLATIEGDPRFAQRELLRHPRTGSLCCALAEAEGYRAPLANVLERCAHPRLEALIDKGYDTPEYETQFWRMSYYQDWEAADEILERFPSKQFFSEVRAEYLRARDAIGPLDAEVARLRAEIAAGEALEREYAQRQEALATLEARWLHHLRGLVVRFLLETPIEAIAAWLTRAPEIELLFKRASALRHKVHYLDELVSHKITTLRGGLTKELAKLDRHIEKYSRPKHAWTTFEAQEIDRRFRARGEADQRRWQQFERQYTTIYVYDRYDDVRLGPDLLWWDVMTGGRYDGDFLDDVRRFHDARPMYGRARSAGHEPSDDYEWREGTAAANLTSRSETYDPSHTHDIS